MLLWEGGVDSGRVACRCLNAGMLSEGEVDSASVTYSNCCGQGGISWEGGRGRFWEVGVDSGREGKFWEGEVDSVKITYSCKKEGEILGGVHSGRVAYRCRKGDPVYS